VSISLVAGAAAFLLALLWGGWFVNELRRHRIGKQIRAEGPESHAAKAGTPTMGGIIISATVLLTTVPFNLIGHWSMLLPLGVIVGCGVLGGVDDLLNLVGGTKSGLTARVKFAWLLVIGITAALVLHFLLDLHSVYVPFVGKFDIGLWYLPIAVIAIVGMSNAVNFTDGLDTLAGGTVALAFAAYAVIAYLQGQPYLVTFCFTVVGSTLAFLWFNAHPAKVIMGDTGSLALGATLATVALMTGQWLLLPLIGIVFVAEVLSVMLQVTYFRISGGKRIFKMAPLHHHFELSGWPETQVTMRFWLIGMIAAMIGISLALS